MVISRNSWEKIEKTYNPKQLQETVWYKTKIADKQLKTDLAKKMPQSYYLTDKALRVGFDIILGSHHINHSNSKLTTKPNISEIEIETIYVIKIVREMVKKYARLINHYKYKNETVISARFDKENEDNWILDETELFINFKINHNLLKSDIDNIDSKLSFDFRIHQQKLQYSGWIFDKTNSMTLYFYKTVEVNGTSFVKNPLRSSAILNFATNGKYCFVWWILAELYPCNISRPNKISNYKQNFNELNIDWFDFSNEFKCNDVYKVEKLNNSYIKISELSFYQDQKKWNHKIIAIEITKNDSERDIDLLIYKNHYVLLKKIHIFMFTGRRNCKYICRRCLVSYTSQNILIIHKERCEQQ